MLVKTVQFGPSQGAGHAAVASPPRRQGWAPSTRAQLGSPHSRLPNGGIAVAWAKMLSRDSSGAPNVSGGASWATA
eukprot:15474576-Alexandrium_andersonii.AAC.1